MMDNMEYGEYGLKDIEEKEAKEEQQEDPAVSKEKQQKEDVHLTIQKHEKTLKGAYRNFVISGVPKIDVDSYLDQALPCIKTLIKDQLKEIGSAKIIMTQWVRWKKPVKLAITLDPDDVEGAQDIGGNISNNYTRVDMPCNSQMREFFKGSDIKQFNLTNACIY